MILAFSILGLLTFAAWFDEKLENRKPVLGEEWDFTQPFIKKKY